ncbi:serine hydrolase domain-containing protein [Halobacillus yeomjeoni]|uniref:Serine hydrolase n=1 Tax=Halobacillus yeomjeoni TaxID=311194 RepID=A0A931HU48_9BACI|nr:serine hydrolase [Halobacillus yeomjeoni]MBH0229775.1 serine hydrolase [Halobacillus yeomjeoni]
MTVTAGRKGQHVSSTIENEGFSGSIVVKVGSETRLAQANGDADRANGRRNGIETRFGIASGSKLFTAVAIAKLVEEGSLSFETPIKDIFGDEFPNFHKDLTVHHLLTHTSGIPDYFDEAVMDNYEDLWKEIPMYQIRKTEDFFPLFKDKAMMFHPGEKFHYNNAGYIMLGYIVEKLSGMSIQQFIQEQIFIPAGMMDSGYFRLDQLPERCAWGHIQLDDGRWKTNMYSVPVIGGADGGAFVTGPDMVKFWEAFMENALFSEEVTGQMLNPFVSVKEGVQYGYGIWINSKDNKVSKYHVMGYDPGVSFHSAYYPETNGIAVILSNQCSGAFSITKAIEESERLY